MRRTAFFLFIILGWVNLQQGLAQNKNQTTATPADSILAPPLPFTPGMASQYILRLVESEKLWKDENDTLRFSLKRLVDHYKEPFDTIGNRIRRFRYDSININPGWIINHDTVPIRWLAPFSFIVDTIPLDKDPFVTYTTIVMRAVDTISINSLRLLPDFLPRIDSLLQVKDTLTQTVIDTRYLAQKKVQIYEVDDDDITPPLLPRRSRKTVKFLADSTGIVFTESLRVNLANEESPFHIVPDKTLPDSLNLAVEILLDYTFTRDSILLYVNNLENRKTPFWLSSNERDPYRYWVKNLRNDSVTVWMSNPSKYELNVVLEDDIYVERLEKRTADDMVIPTARPVRTLASLTALKEIPVYWSYDLINAFSMNQNYLSNWSRGGESSLSGMIDITGTAKYSNKESKDQWTSSGRLRYGTIRTKERGFRTSTDMIEINSQYNRKILEKFDFSSVFYGKTQVAQGFQSPTDTVVVSKFLNPGTFTVGVGFEYEPIKKTLINFSPLSYRNTFVLDTVNINQTNHGIEQDKRTRQEMGGQIVIKNSMTLFDDLKVNNNIRLFSNYLDKPQNIDMDWEMSLEKQISYLFSIRLNLHLIYDDDVRFPVFNSAGELVLLPDQTPYKVAKAQFNQFLGLTFSFRL
jgi:hypothetical protein